MPGIMRRELVSGVLEQPAMNFVGRSLVRLGNALYPMFVGLAIAGCATEAIGSEDLGPDAAIAPDVAAPAPDAPKVPVSGDLDPSFGQGGMLPLDVGTGYAAALTVQGDKLIACVTIRAGANTVARMIRVDADGAIDTTFGTEGQATLGIAGIDVACKDLVATTTRLALNYRGYYGTSIMFRDADGSFLGTDHSTPGAHKLTPLADDYVAATGQQMGNTQLSLVVRMATNHVTYPVSGLEGTLTRAWVDGDDENATSTGVGTLGAVPAWQVATGAKGVPLTPLGDGARASAGGPAVDLMHDAIRLSDGSVFAIGSVDTGAEVMVARFVKGATSEAFVEHHPIGASASGRAVTLDGNARPIVVGDGVVNGTPSFAWQRYLATSSTLDAAYGAGGVMTAAPPSGHGELVDVERFGGKLYALGHYDLETAAPKIVLVRILE